jgi:hypothetical protein
MRIRCQQPEAIIRTRSRWDLGNVHATNASQAGNLTLTARNNDKANHGPAESPIRLPALTGNTGAQRDPRNRIEGVMTICRPKETTERLAWEDNDSSRREGASKLRSDGNGEAPKHHKFRMC